MTKRVKHKISRNDRKLRFDFFSKYGGERSKTIKGISIYDLLVVHSDK